MPVSSPDVKDATDVEEAVVATNTELGAKDPAESPPAEATSEKGDMLSAVKAALEPKEKSLNSESQDSKPDATAEAAPKEGDKPDEDSDDFTEEELTQLAKLKPKTHKRITKLLDEKKADLREIEDLKPQAQQFQQMARFVQDAGLSVDEVNRGFDAMRNLKQDPLKAYEQIKPIFLQLQQMVGEVLPEDLVQEVSQGRLTEAHARELALARTRTTLATQRVQTFEQQNQQRQEVEAFESRRNAAAGSVSEWERTKSKSDPDWKLKQSRVTELIELDLHRRQKSDPNFFPSSDEAVSMAEAALKKVNEEMKRFNPRPKAVNAVTDVASTRSTAKPANMLEAAKQGLAQARAG